MKKNIPQLGHVYDMQMIRPFTDILNQKTNTWFQDIQNCINKAVKWSANSNLIFSVKRKQNYCP